VTNKAIPLTSPKGSSAIASPLQLLLLVIVTLVAYAPSIGNGFVYDDHDLIEKNPLVIGGWERAGEHFTTDFWELTRHPSPYYRPIVTLSFLVDAQLWKMDPRGFHVQTMLWHLGCVLLIYAFFRRLHPQSSMVALGGALLFALHPIHTQSVAWIAGRTDVMATFFLVAFLAAYLSWRKEGGRWRFVLMVVAFALAFLSKEVAAVGIVLLVALELALRRDDPVGWRRPIIAITVALVLLVVLLVVRKAAIGAAIGMIPGQDPSAWWTPEDGVSSRLIAVGRILLFYLGRLVWPVSLSLEDGITPRTSIDAASALGFLIAAALVVIVVWSYRRSPLVALGIAATLIPLVPVLNILPLYQAAQEHFLYLPSVGVSLIAGVGFARLGKRGWPVLALVAVGFGALTFARNPVWSSDIRVWTDAARKAPHSARAHVGLATAWYMETQSDHPSAEVKRTAIDSARASLARGLAHDPDYFHGILLDGVIAYETGDTLRAAERFGRAHAVHPTNTTARYNHGKLLLEIGRAEEALSVLAPARHHLGGDPHFEYVYARALWATGRRDQAISVLRRAVVELVPHWGEFWLHLGHWYVEMGNDRDGLAALERAAMSFPNHPGLLYNIACLQSRRGRLDDAMASLEAAIRAGYANRDQIARDSDLDPLRSDPRFEAAFSRIP